MAARHSSGGSSATPNDMSKTAHVLIPDQTRVESASSRSPSQQRGIRLKNASTGMFIMDTLHRKAQPITSCTESVCRGSVKCCPPRRQQGSRRREEIVAQARQFLEEYYESHNRLNSKEHKDRLAQVEREVAMHGTYDLRLPELIFGAKLAWRNSPRCIGRIQWSKLQVFDARHVKTTVEMFEALLTHIKYATNDGALRCAITVFPQRTDGKHDFYIWNSKLVGYCGYRMDSGKIIGDSIHLEFTEFCQSLGWKPKYGEWNILPLVLSANGGPPEFFEIPESHVLRVPLSHPKHGWFKELDLQWYALSAFSSMMLDCGGVEFTAVAFSGWHQETQIGSTALADPQRYNVLPEIGRRMGLDMTTQSSLWKDFTVAELNLAILHSFKKHRVTIVDHYTSSENFMKHFVNEHRARGGCPSEWGCITPCASSANCPPFHQEMLRYYLKPSFEQQELQHRLFRLKSEGEVYTITLRSLCNAVMLASNLYVTVLCNRIPCTVLYASETGRSEGFAKTVGSVFNHSFKATVCCMSEYDVSNLRHEQLLLVVCSTMGNGSSPENGMSFARFLLRVKESVSTSEASKRGDADKRKSVFIRRESLIPAHLRKQLGAMRARPSAQKEELLRATEPYAEYHGVRFAVFGVGSSAYPNFCSFGKFLDNLMHDIKMTRIYDFAMGDELCGQDESFRMWAYEVFETACRTFCIEDDEVMHDVAMFLNVQRGWSEENVKLVDVVPQKRDQARDVCAGLSKLGKRSIFQGKLFTREDLHTPTDDHKTILLSIDVSQVADLNFDPGDMMGIYPKNRGEEVEAILKRVKDCPNPDAPCEVLVKHAIRTSCGIRDWWNRHDRLPPCSLKHALTWYLDIDTPPSSSFLACLAATCSTDRDRESLEKLSSNPVSYEQWKAFKYPHLAEVLSEFASARPTAAFLLTKLPPLQPRYYSISSSPLAFPDEVHLTVSVVSFATRDGKGPVYHGVCSTYLASAPIGEPINCFLRKDPLFHLPEDTSLPVIMIGPGSGIAPFRSFWQQRKMDQDAGRKFGPMSLFFGCRSPNVQIYADEVKLMKDTNVLDFVSVAYSRVSGQTKRYVQHDLTANAKEVYNQVVKQNGHVYVSGDVQMADDVAKTIIKIFEEVGDIPVTEATELFEKMRMQETYHEVIFGLTLGASEARKKGQQEAAERFRVNVSPGKVAALQKLTLSQD